MNLYAKQILAVCALIFFGTAFNAPAVLLYDQDVTFGDVAPVTMLYGSNSNGAFTVDRRNGIEIGLRAQLRFDANNQAQNIFNSNGDGTYSFPTGTPNLSLPRPSWATTTTPVWNVTFSVNTDYEDRDDTPSALLGDYTYEVGFDFDPAGTNNWLIGDPISSNGLFATFGVPDHGFGLYSQQSPGYKATSSPDYAAAVNTYSIVQNTTNCEFFNMNLTLFGYGDYSGFDPNQPGVYTIFLAAYQGTTEMARSEIEVWVGTAVHVPNVLGMTESEAGSALAAENLVLGMVAEQYSATQAGLVIEQAPAAGDGLPLGSAVDVVISKGPPPPVPAAGNPGIVVVLIAISLTGMAQLSSKRV